MVTLIIYIILRSFISIRLRNANGYSAFSEAIELLIFDENQTISDSTTATVDTSLTPSKPKISVAAYNILDKQFYLKWLVDSNGGSDIEEIEVKFLKYNSFGPTEVFVNGKQNKD